jgi:hypothetical protein
MESVIDLFLLESDRQRMPDIANCAYGGLAGRWCSCPAAPELVGRHCLKCQLIGTGAE